MSPLPVRLLPDNASIGDDGHLLVAGCDTLELAETFGTPLFVYDEEHLRARCRESVAAFGRGVNYATKAFLCKAMARLAYEEGMNLDVSTGGEYAVARAAGVPAASLVLHGNNKSTDELRLAAAEGVHHIVVDSFDEFDRLDQIVAEGIEPPKVLVRITPGIEAHTHHYVQTGQHDSKFGFGVLSGAAAAAVDRAKASSSVRFDGLHVHIGSQIFEAEFFERAVAVVAPLLSGTDGATLSVGGGLGVAYLEDERAPTITEWATSVRKACADVGFTGPIVAEPGRAIVASAGITLYTVGTIKEVPDVRTYLAVDGGMSDNPRPVLYGSGYETFLPRRVDADRPTTVTVVGKHCESGDVVVRDGHVPVDVVVGDILATPVTGAYGHSMGSNYNKVPRPPVVFVRDGVARVVVRRETTADLLRLDV
jgi:diaminopimelate decarboxylase